MNSNSIFSDSSEWNYERMIEVAESIENKINDLLDPGQLLVLYVGEHGQDIESRRAWSEVAPAAALRKFGDCAQVNELLTVANVDLFLMLLETQERTSREKNTRKNAKQIKI